MLCTVDCAFYGSASAAEAARRGGAGFGLSAGVKDPEIQQISTDAAPKRDQEAQMRQRGKAALNCKDTRLRW